MPDLSETLPRPRYLRRAIVAYVQLPDALTRIACTACSLQKVEDPDGFPTGEWCLHVHAVQLGPDGRFPQKLVSLRLLIPIRFVVYLGYGPYVHETPGAAPDLGILPLDRPTPDNALSLEQISALYDDLAEFVDEEGQHDEG